MKFALLCLFVALSSATVYFSEDFGKGWETRWVASQWKGEEERGALKQTTGKFGDGVKTGVQTSEDARFYTYSAKIPKSFSNKGKTVIFQYSIKQENDLDCGGSYLKFLPGPMDQTQFKGGEGENKYNIMFGPDWCGGGMKRIHAIFNYDGKNHLLERSDYSVPNDHATHFYALQVHANNSYTILIDNEIVQYGTLAEKADYNILPDKEIPDPAVSKPADWVDEAQIPDVTDVKPEGWDDIPATIIDPSAEKPDDWDDELDGEWEAPHVANPEFKGAWKQKKIPNPDYKGPWTHPQIPNPEYKIPEGMTAYDDFSYVGLEIWQVKTGTIFSDILITDSVAEATAAFEKTAAFRAAEAAAIKKDEEEQAAKAAAEAAAAEAAAAESASDSESGSESASASEKQEKQEL